MLYDGPTNSARFDFQVKEWTKKPPDLSPAAILSIRSS